LTLLFLCAPGRAHTLGGILCPAHVISIGYASNDSFNCQISVRAYLSAKDTAKVWIGINMRNRRGT